MGNDDYLDDGYVAALLAQDAKNSGSLYSVSSSSPPKPSHKPKPNTRFLRNIIKDTDSHNAALLAKEAAESRARLKGLVNEGRDIKKESQRKPANPLDVRKRQLGDIAAILGARGCAKRKRDTVERDNTEEDRPQRRRINSSEVIQRASDEKNKPRERRRRDEDDDLSDHSRSPRPHRRQRSSSRERRKPRDEDHKTESKSNTRDSRLRKGSLDEDTRSDSIDDGRRKRRSREDYSEDGDDERRHRHRRDRSTSRDGKDRETKKRRRHRSRSKSRSRSPHKRRHRDSHRSRSPRRKRSRSPESRRESHRKSRRSPSVEKISSRHEKRITHQKEEEEEEYDSDPLSSIIGPPPPPPIPEVRSRGRGAFSHGSGIDSRFSADYDPTADVQLDPDEENDWDQALEALRDRQKWKKQGADRLRAAGFTDDEIRKWEKGSEKTEEDVRWAKRGESREWDRGKILDNDGVVSIEPAFGRLKDS